MGQLTRYQVTMEWVGKLTNPLNVNVSVFSGLDDEDEQSYEQFGVESTTLTVNIVAEDEVTALQRAQTWVVRYCTDAGDLEKFGEKNLWKFSAEPLRQCWNQRGVESE
jgi:hypothetical protein